MTAEQSGSGDDGKKRGKNGFTMIPNDFLDALIRDESLPYAERIRYAIYRHTFGWNAEHQFISNGYLSEVTGICSSNVARTVSGMKKKPGSINIETIGGKNRYSIRHEYYKNAGKQANDAKKTDNGFIRQKKLTSITSDSITSDSITSDSITSDSITSDSITSDSITSDSVNSITSDTGNSITSDTGNSITSDTGNSLQMPSGISFAETEIHIKENINTLSKESETGERENFSSSIFPAAKLLFDLLHEKGLKEANLVEWSELLSKIQDSRENIEKAVKFSQLNDHWKIIVCGKDAHKKFFRNYGENQGNLKARSEAYFLEHPEQIPSTVSTSKKPPVTFDFDSAYVIISSIKTIDEYRKITSSPPGGYSEQDIRDGNCQMMRFYWSKNDVLRQLMKTKVKTLIVDMIESAKTQDELMGIKSKHINLFGRDANEAFQRKLDEFSPKEHND